MHGGAVVVMNIAKQSTDVCMEFIIKQHVVKIVSTLTYRSYQLQTYAVEIISKHSESTSALSSLAIRQ